MAEFCSLIDISRLRYARFTRITLPGIFLDLLAPLVVNTSVVQSLMMRQRYMLSSMFHILSGNPIIFCFYQLRFLNPENISPFNGFLPFCWLMAVSVCFQPSTQSFLCITFLNGVFILERINKCHLWFQLTRRKSKAQLRNMLYFKITS